MNTESKEPLYRQLNKERNQGVFSVEDTPMGTGKGLEKQLVTEKALIASFRHHDWNMSKQVRRYTKENIATAKYTALAINNLSSLAEALEMAIKMFWSNERTYNRQGLKEKYPQHYIWELEEALNKIS